MAVFKIIFVIYRMDYGGLNKLMMLMRIWWLIHVLLDIVSAFYSTAALE